MSWTHVICEEDFRYRRGREAQPVRLKEEYRSTEPCCFCGEPTRDGIYYRFDGTQLPQCRGHDD